MSDVELLKTQTATKKYVENTFSLYEVPKDMKGRYKNTKTQYQDAPS